MAFVDGDRVRGDPGDDEAVGILDEVIASQRVDEVAVAAQVGPSDRHQLPIPTRRRDDPCRVESTRVPFHSAAIATTAVVAVVSACAEIQAIASASPPIARRITSSTPSSVMGRACTVALTVR